MRFIPAVFMILVVFLSSQLQAQLKVNDVSIYKVTYIAKHFYDTTDLTKVRVDSMATCVGKEYSVFRNADYEAFLKRKEQQRDQVIMEMRSGSTNIKMPTIKKVPPSEMFKKNDSNEILMKEELAGNTYLISDTIPFIKWDINSEIKKVGGFDCQKAVGKYKGRIYTAWFCPDLPIRTGPWTLSGLPGTILEAVDSKNHVQFLFAGFEELTDRNILISSPEKYIRSSKKDWERLLTAYMDDPLQFINNAISAKGIDTKISIQGGSLPWKKMVINNPIILPEK